MKMKKLLLLPALLLTLSVGNVACSYHNDDNPNEYPDPQPEPEPEPEPDPSPDPGTGGDGESYKRDLKLLFPFCIPFDFIHLIQALKAEPETPKFEIPVKLDFVDVDTSIVIDLAWMDPIMKIWRLGELGLFIVMLMKSTSKVIRW